MLDRAGLGVNAPFGMARLQHLVAEIGTGKTVIFFVTIAAMALLVITTFHASYASFKKGWRSAAAFDCGNRHLTTKWLKASAALAEHGRAAASKECAARIAPGNGCTKGTASAMPFERLPAVMVTNGAVVQPGPHAALLETCGRNRMGKGHSCRASRTVPCPHARRGNPRLTLDSDWNPLRRLLLGS